MSSDEEEEDKVHPRKGKGPTKGSWVPGQSGNPKGRPKKNQVLSDILTDAGERSFKYKDSDGITHNSKYSEFIAKQVMEALATGQVTFPPLKEGDSERKMPLDAGDYNRLLQFYFQRVEGLARKATIEDGEKQDELPLEEMKAIRDTRWDDVQDRFEEMIEREDNEIENQPETRLSN